MHQGGQHSPPAVRTERISIMAVEPGQIKRCKCGADIFFATTEKGKQTPLDVKPVRVAVLEDVEGGPPKIIQGVKGYISHFGTCPDVDDFRKRGGK